MHSNGFSLVRHVVERAGLHWNDPAPFDPQQSLGAALLTPTRIYVRPALAAVRAGGVNAMAHITGGGLSENIPRVLPERLGARIDPQAWTTPAVFDWLAQAGGISDAEMRKTFNCGIGLVLVCAPEAAAGLLELLRAQGERAEIIGSVVSGEGVRYGAMQA